MKRFQTRKALAEKYDVDRRTITEWIKRAGLGDRIRRALTPLEIEIFIAKIGTPEMQRRNAHLLGIEAKS